MTPAVTDFLSRCYYKGWKMLCTAMSTLLNELKEAIFAAISQGNIPFKQSTILMSFRSMYFIL